MTRGKIVGTGAYAPERVLTNADLEKMVETSDEWILQRTGIRERHVVDPGVATSDLGKEAAVAAIERAGLTPDDIDVIVVGTVTPDMMFPSTACLIQDKMASDSDCQKLSAPISRNVIVALGDLGGDMTKD